MPAVFLTYVINAAAKIFATFDSGNISRNSRRAPTTIYKEARIFIAVRQVSAAAVTAIQAKGNEGAKKWFRAFLQRGVFVVEFGRLGTLPHSVVDVRRRRQPDNSHGCILRLFFEVLELLFLVTHADGLLLREKFFQMGVRVIRVHE